MDNIDICLWNEVISYLDTPSRFTLSCVNRQLLSFREKDVSIYYLMICSARSGHLEIMQWLYEANPYLSPNIIRYAACNGHLKILEWYYSKVGTLPKRTCEYAAVGGYIDMFKWAMEKGCLPLKSYRHATMHGMLDFLKFLIAEKYPIYDDLCSIAVRNGKDKTLEYLLDSGFIYNNSNTEIHKNHIAVLEVLESRGYSISYRGGDLDVVKWCFERGCPLTDDVLLNAARKGDIETVKFCLANGLQLSDGVFNNAAEAGKLKFLKWLVSEGYRFGEQISLYAARSGKIKILEWLVSIGINIHLDADCYAAMYDRLNVLLWLGENVSDNDVFVNAVYGGSISVLNWLNEKGFRYQYVIGENIISGDQPDTIDWLLEHEYNFGCNITETAIIHNCVDTLRWIIDTGKPVNVMRLLETGHTKEAKHAHTKGYKLPDNICDYFANEGNLRYLEWAIINGFEVRKSSLYVACLRNHIHVLKWALTKGLKIGSRVLSAAVENNHIDIIRWAIESKIPFSDIVLGMLEEHGMTELLKK